MFQVMAHVREERALGTQPLRDFDSLVQTVMRYFNAN
jgi:hypothetical protein